MTEPTFEAFEGHVQQIQEYLPLNLSESDTRVYLIDPLLSILGYKDVSNLRREVPIPATKETLDYELLTQGQPVAIVEAKALCHRLNDQHAAQCVQYASVLGIRWCLIANGISYALYDAYGKGPLAEKRIITVTLNGDQNETEKAWEVLSLFSRDALGKTNLLNPLEHLLVERVIADELTRPNSPAIEALRRVTRARFGERVSGEMVVAVAQKLMKKEQPSLKPKPVPDTTNTRKPARSDHNGERRVTLSDLVNTGFLPADASLEVQIKGVKFAGRIKEGKIEANGQLFSTPSSASIGLRKVLSWNGWTDWEYNGETLAQIRNRYENAKKPSQLNNS